ncbi:MAG TPA: CoA pyrophosphatase [Bacteroidota bacterium]|nr:CoA pyrophosphatase [Bacteroidota bacterium]
MPSSLQENVLRGLREFAAPVERRGLTIEGFRRAGVLVPLVIGTRKPELLFTKRTEEVESHKGQISFPGGMTDTGDADIVETALREVREELGIAASAVTVRGILDDLAVPSGFIITPVVGTLETLPPLMPNPSEVAEAFTVPLDFFCEPRNGRSEIRELHGTKREVWFYEHRGRTIWGATAMIVRTLVLKMGMLRR